MTADVNQFVMLTMLRGQLEEIHHALEKELLSKIKRPEDGFRFNQPVELQVTIHVTNIGKNKPEKLAIEELTRLSTFVDSLRDGINYMSDRLYTQRDNGASESVK